jgi:hypothetical protein
MATMWTLYQPLRARPAKMAICSSSAPLIVAISPADAPGVMMLCSTESRSVSGGVMAVAEGRSPSSCALAADISAAATVANALCMRCRSSTSWHHQSASLGSGGRPRR